MMNTPSKSFDYQDFFERASGQELLEFAKRLVEQSQSDPLVAERLEKLDLEPLFSRLPFKKDLREGIDLLVQHNIGKRNGSYLSNYLDDEKALDVHAAQAFIDMDSKNFIRIREAQSNLSHIAKNPYTSSKTLESIYQHITDFLISIEHIDNTQETFVETIKTIIKHHQCPNSIFETLLNDPQHLSVFLATCSEFRYVSNPAHVQKALEKLLKHAQGKNISIDLEKAIINIASHLDYMTKETGFPEPLARKVLTHPFQWITNGTLAGINDRFFKGIPKTFITSLIEEKQTFSPFALHCFGYREDLDKETFDYLIKESVRHHLRQNISQQEGKSLNILVPYFHNKHVRFKTLEWVVKNLPEFEVSLVAAPSCQTSDLILLYHKYKDDRIYSNIILNHPNFPNILKQNWGKQNNVSPAKSMK